VGGWAAGIELDGFGTSRSARTLAVMKFVFDISHLFYFVTTDTYLSFGADFLKWPGCGLHVIFVSSTCIMPSHIWRAFISGWRGFVRPDRADRAHSDAGEGWIFMVYLGSVVLLQACAVTFAANIEIKTGAMRGHVCWQQRSDRIIHSPSSICAPLHAIKGENFKLFVIIRIITCAIS
jgi:hypothetical protein